ncbi:MAG: radical SAM protein [Deltaproteobacteria bacterium]|nr:radical SAM protein [Deltaproteobacteria bacterium]
MSAPPFPFTLRVEAQGPPLLYDRAAHAYTRRTAAEAFLLTAAQDIGADSAVALLADRTDGDTATDTARTLRELGALDDDGVFAGRVVEPPEVPGAFGAPLVAHLGVTLACNYSCAHCYSSSGRRAPGELTLDEIRALTGQLAAAGCMKLVLGGGEPFLRRDLAAMVRHAHGLGVDAYVHTNASLLRDEALSELARCPPAGLAVSLDGPDPATNDAIRGEGTFASTLRGMERLRTAYPPGFNLNVTITPHNAATTPGLVELAHRVGARVLLLRPAYPAGEARHDDSLTCDRDTFARAVDAARPRAEALGLALDAPHPHEQGIPGFDGFGCVASRVVLGIAPTGDVTPCLNLPGSFIAGNVRTSSLAQLWAGGSTFLDLRAAAPGPYCATCLHYETCRGGCRVRALHVGGGLSDPDGWCHYSPRPGMTPPAPSTRPHLRVVT